MEPRVSPRLVFFFPNKNDSISLLVDTGSSVSLLPADMCTSNSSESRSYHGRVLSVCGSELVVVGESREKFCGGGMTFVHDFLACKGIGFPILGVDFLCQHASVVDLSRRVVSFPKGVVPFDDSHGRVVTASVDGRSFLDGVVQEYSDTTYYSGR